MANEANKTLIGVFIVGALLLALAGIVLFGTGSFFKKGRFCVLYFEGSVKGLTLGAPVQMKGVTIGKVNAIQLIFDPGDMSIVNRVVIEASPGLVESSERFRQDGGKADLSDEMLDLLVDRGLRAKLVLESFVTGKLLVSLDFYPDTQVKLFGAEKELKELPTLRSDLEELAKTLEEIPLPELARSVTRTLEGIEKIVASPEWAKILHNTNVTLERIGHLAERFDRHSEIVVADIEKTLQDTRYLIARIDRQVEPLTREIIAAAGDARQVIREIGAEVGPVLVQLTDSLGTAQRTLAGLERVMANLKDITAENSPLLYRVNEAMMETAAAAMNLRVLADYLNRHPEALLHGKSESGDRR